jgi:hypothetical protein
VEEDEEEEGRKMSMGEGGI